MALTVLGALEGGTAQDSKKGRGSEREELTRLGHSEKDSSGQRKKTNKQGTLTYLGAQRERNLRTAKERQQAKRTHLLESADGGTSQDSEKGVRAKGTHQLESPDRGTTQENERE